MTAGLRRFWLGLVPLGESFWLWGILGGGVVNLFGTLFALIPLTLGGPAWITVALIVLHIPINLFLLVGVWRSAGAADVSGNARMLARLCMSVWAFLLSLV